MDSLALNTQSLHSNKKKSPCIPAAMLHIVTADCRKILVNNTLI
jgi:hypothetical protein